MRVPDALALALARDLRDLDALLTNNNVAEDPALEDFRARYWPAAREIIALADQLQTTGESDGFYQ